MKVEMKKGRRGGDGEGMKEGREGGKAGKQV